jgi:hypothetical protein
MLGSRTLLTAPGPIDWAQLGPDGSALVLVDGTVERFVGARRMRTLPLTDRWTGGPPVGSPDTCFLAFPTEIGYRVEPMCVDGAPLETPAAAVAWSPDGQWLAMAMENRAVPPSES